MQPPPAFLFLQIVCRLFFVYGPRAFVIFTAGSCGCKCFSADRESQSCPSLFRFNNVFYFINQLVHFVTFLETNLLSQRRSHKGGSAPYTNHAQPPNPCNCLLVLLDPTPTH
jgi:hypothetical protein